MKDLQFVGAMGPPGGARNNLDPRFVSLFDTFEVQFPSTTNLQTIYTSILAHHVASLSDEIKGQFILPLMGKTSLGNVWLACLTPKAHCNTPLRAVIHHVVQVIEILPRVCQL